MKLYIYIYINFFPPPILIRITHLHNCITQLLIDLNFSQLFKNCKILFLRPINTIRFFISFDICSFLFPFVSFASNLHVRHSYRSITDSRPAYFIHTDKINQ